MKNKETRQARYAKNCMRKSILIDMYLDNDLEKNLCENWKKESVRE